MGAVNENQAILHFFRDDIGGILINDAAGEILYEDEGSAFVRKNRTNWKVACPPLRQDQKGEDWDLLDSENGKTYMVYTSTFEADDGTPLQIHQITEISVYTNLSREISDYSQMLRSEKEHDRMTGLFNKGKLMDLKQSLFGKQKTMAVFNMDINNLKETNDTYGHEAGDRLIKKAAESLKRIEARNIMPFRVGGDEFITVAIHVNRKQAEKIQQKWEAALAELNRKENGIPCIIAVGFAFGENDFDMEEVFAEADRRMYEDKKAKKNEQIRCLS